MIKSQHKSNNHVLGAPPGVPIEECEALPITVTNYSCGHVGLKSFWKPTDEELEVLLQGGFVTLEVLTDNHPPVILGTSQ